MNIAALLKELNPVYSALFQDVLTKLGSAYKQYTHTITNAPSNEISYGWLANMLGEFLDIDTHPERVANGFDLDAYKIKAKRFHLTTAVKIDDLKFNKANVIATLEQLAKQYAIATEQFEVKQVVDLLANGKTADSMTGAKFFALDHPYKTKAGVAGTQANLISDAGYAGQPWYLISDPLCLLRGYVNGETPDFLWRDDPKNSDVAWTKFTAEFGTTFMNFAAYGQPLFITRVEQTLDEQNLQDAYDFMSARVDANGNQVNTAPTMLLTGKSNRQAAQNILVPQVINGTTNVSAGLVKHVNDIWLP